MDEQIGSVRRESLTLPLAMGLAAPHTWAASILPALLGAALSAARQGARDSILFCCLLAICVLMQSAVNTLNDYCDFIKHTDTRENSDDPSDAILVYHKISPRQALLLGVGFLAAAGSIGLWVTLRCGWLPLCIGLLGGAVILLYSFGSSPISYLPLGEAVSGFVMGGLIPLAVYTALTGQAALWVLWRSAPLILGIGLIMLTNNISDIERDIPAGRKTLAVLMGRLKAAGLYRAMLILWPLLITVMTIVEDFAGAVILPPLFLLAGPALLRQAALPLTPPVRGAAMRGILHLNLVLGLGCILIPLLSRILSGGRL